MEVKVKRIMCKIKRRTIYTPLPTKKTMAFKCVLVILVYIITKALSYISLIKLMFFAICKVRKNAFEILSK